MSDTDWSSVSMNNYQNLANSLFGKSSDVNIGGGISGDTLSQWNMLKTNSAAYKKLLQAQETGTIRQNTNSYESISDRLYNDYYDSSTGKVTAATYTPASDASSTAASEDFISQLESMQNIASAASGNPNSLNDNYYSLFETLRKNIAGALSTTGGSSSTTTSTEAQAATLAGTASFRYLDDAQSFTVTGSKGSVDYSFGEGESLQNIADAINADTASTGVIAELEKDASGQVVNISLKSQDSGASAFVKVSQTAGDLFAAAGGTKAANGVDAKTNTADVVASGGDGVAAIATGVYGGTLVGDQKFTITGASGSQTFSFAGGTSAEDVVAAINEASSSTGIIASVIVNADGEAEGIGLESSSTGVNQYLRVEQEEGYLFTAPGRTVSVRGTSANPDDANDINSLSQLGVVKIGDSTYSFADLAPGGSASLENNPDAAYMVIEQALRDIYSGRAVLNGLDLDEAMLDATNTGAMVTNNVQATNANNAVALNNWGSGAIDNWLANRLVATEE